MTIRRLLLTTSALLLTSSPLFADIDPSKLIKVTPGNNPDCVEYYNYNNEMYCSTTALSPDSVDPNIIHKEKQKIVFDQRAWHPAWSDIKPTISTIEYIPAGDSINKWNELITSQFIPDLQSKVTLKNYVNLIIQGIKDSGFKPIVTFHEDTPEQIIFEYRITDPANVAQDEIQKMTMGKDGIYILHYVIKKADMGHDNRTKWLANLKKSSIK